VAAILAPPVEDPGVDFGDLFWAQIHGGRRVVGLAFDGPASDDVSAGALREMGARAIEAAAWLEAADN
jgi:hypothetical protein